MIQARNYTPANRTAADIRVVVWHDMEAPESHDTAERVARWFAGSSAPRASAHVCCDPDSTVDTVRLDDIAWHAPGANHDGAGIELAGYARQTAAEWRDRTSLATITRACEWVVAQPLLAHIPDRWLTDTQLADGTTRGHCTHAQVSRVFQRSDHWDPGPHFPADHVMAELGRLRGDDDMTPDERRILNDIWARIVSLTPFPDERINRAGEPDPEGVGADPMVRWQIETTLAVRELLTRNLRDELTSILAGVGSSVEAHTIEAAAEKAVRNVLREGVGS